MIAYRAQFPTRLKLGKFFCRAQVAVIVAVIRSFKSRTQLRAVRPSTERKWSTKLQSN